MSDWEELNDNLNDLNNWMDGGNWSIAPENQAFCDSVAVADRDDNGDYLFKCTQGGAIIAGAGQILLIIVIVIIVLVLCAYFACCYCCMKGAKAAGKAMKKSSDK